MQLAVKLYKDVLNKPSGIPDEWPAEIIERNKSDPPLEGSWLYMSKEEYVEYQNLKQAKYKEWLDPILAVELENEKKKKRVAANLEHGKRSIAEMLFCSIGQKDDELLKFSSSCAKTMQLLSLGFIKLSISELISISDLSMLDQPYGSNQTIREHLVEFMLSGDQE